RPPYACAPPRLHHQHRLGGRHALDAASCLRTRQGRSHCDHRMPRRRMGPGAGPGQRGFSRLYTNPGAAGCDRQGRARPFIARRQFGARPFGRAFGNRQGRDLSRLAACVGHYGCERAGRLRMAGRAALAHLWGLAAAGQCLSSRADSPAARSAKQRSKKRKDVMTTFSADLARFLVGLRTENMPPEVVQKARVCLYNAFGMGINGHATPYAPVARAAALALDGEVAGGATLFLDGRRTTIGGACLANSALFHGRAQEDTCGAAHFGTILIPLLTAMIEARGYPLSRLIPAVVAG